MKTTFVFAGLLATALMAQAETMSLKIPFAFSVTGKAMPAGEYVIKTVPGSPGVISIQGIESEATSEATSGAMVLGRITKAKELGASTAMFKESVMVGVTIADLSIELNGSEAVSAPAPILTAANE